MKTGKTVSFNSNSLVGERTLSWALACGSLYFLYWLIGAFPAIASAWWYLDDYNIYDPEFTPLGALLRGGISNGRPLLGLYCQPLFWDRPPIGNGINNIMTIFQIATHCLAGGILASVFARHGGRWIGLLAGFLFVAWPLHFEAVLWYSACLYPYGALLAMTGIYQIEKGMDSGETRNFCLGGCLVLLGMWSSQNSGAIPMGLVIFLAMIRYVRSDRPALKSVIRGFAITIGVSAFAAIVSVLLMKYFEKGRILATPLHKRINFIFDQFYDYGFFPGIYDWPTLSVHALVFVIVLYVMFDALFMRRIKFTTLVILVGISFFPTLAGISANVVSGDIHPAYRIQYAHPVLGACLILIGGVLSFRPVHRVTLSFAVLMSIIPYGLLLHKGSSELVELFHLDQTLYEELETFAESVGSDQVVFMDWKHSAPWNHNPHNLRMKSLGSLVGILHTDTSNYRALLIFTNLKNVPREKWEYYRKRYEEKARQLPNDRPAYFLHDQTDNVIVVVPR